jgi:hypothetical protein
MISLQPELFRFTEGTLYVRPSYLNAVPTSNFSVHDNDELVSHASTLLVRMCGVTPPLPLVNPILDAIFEAIQSSPVRPVLPCYSPRLISLVVMEGPAESSSSCSR